MLGEHFKNGYSQVQADTDSQRQETHRNQEINKVLLVNDFSHSTGTTDTYIGHFFYTQMINCNKCLVISTTSTLGPCPVGSS